MIIVIFLILYETIVSSLCQEKRLLLCVAYFVCGFVCGLIDFAAFQQCITNDDRIE